MLCTTKPYSDFSLRLHYLGIRNNIPLNGGIEVTTLCNFRCIHCYIRCDEAPACVNNEISLQEFCNIIDQISDAGCLWLQITGGEPLLHKDFRELYLYAKRKGLLPIVFTNGSLITEDIARLFKEFPPFSIEITLYGASENTYEVVTGNGKNYDKVINGIELLKKYGVKFKLKSAIIKQNITDLEQMRSIAKGYGCSLSYDFAINQGLNSGLPLEDLRISPEEVVLLDVEDPARYDEWKRLYRDFKLPEEKRSMLFWCSAGAGNFHIDSGCLMSACIMCRTPAFDLRRGAFWDGWLNVISANLKQRRTRESECTQCEDQILCHQCPGHAMLEHKDREKRIGYFCEIAKLRKSRIINS